MRRFQDTYMTHTHKYTLNCLNFLTVQLHWSAGVPAAVYVLNDLREQYKYLRLLQFRNVLFAAIVNDQTTKFRWFKDIINEGIPQSKW